MSPGIVYDTPSNRGRGKLMRKVNLRMNEEIKYELIKKCVETQGNKKTVALKLKCTTRTVNRLIKKYKELGKEGFIHGNRNRIPITAFPHDIKQSVIALYQSDDYINANFRHFSELLETLKGIQVSESTIHSWMKEIDILSPKAKRHTKKKLKEKLKQRKKVEKSKKTVLAIESKLELLDRYVAHPRRPRCANFGELVQMDASPHLWFGASITHLHLAIDDATGKILGAYFDTQETLNAYYNVFYQILTHYGIPYKFLTDGRTVFEYKLKKAPSDYEDTHTQFSYACSQLGVELECSSIPQAKGRVERLNQTLQSRLVVELRLAGINTIERANQFLSSYLRKFNSQFSLPIHDTKSVFEKQPTPNEINRTLAILSSRVIDHGHCIKYKNKYYLPITSSGVKTYVNKGTSALVIESFNQELYVNILDQLFLLEEVPERHHLSKNFDLIPDVIIKKKYIPPLTHPWKQDSFLRYLSKQKHRPEFGANH